MSEAVNSCCPGYISETVSLYFRKYETEVWESLYKGNHFYCLQYHETTNFKTAMSKHRNTTLFYWEFSMVIMLKDVELKQSK
jgi:hypothetical protein